MSIKKRLRLEVIRQKNHIPSTVWLVLHSLIMGSFFVYYNDFLFSRTEPYLQHYPSGWIGGVLIAAALLEGYAVIYDKNKLRYIGVVALAATWGTLTLLAFTYHMGTGYPDNSFISYGFAVIMAIFVAYEGVYKD